jgi:hypothetical protein
MQVRKAIRTFVALLLAHNLFFDLRLGTSGPPASNSSLVLLGSRATVWLTGYRFLAFMWKTYVRSCIRSSKPETDMIRAEDPA